MLFYYCPANVSIVRKRSSCNLGGRASVPPPAAFLQEQAASALGPVAHKAPGPEPSHRAARCGPVGVWRPNKALKALFFFNRWRRSGVPKRTTPPYQQHAHWGPSRVFSAYS